jgi:azurin
MNIKLALPLLACGLLVAGCGKKEESSAAAPSASVKPAAPAVVEVEITANDTMKFSVTRIEAKPGQDVKVTLTNIGSMPKAAMGHNFVLLKKGVDPKEIVDAAVSAAATDYVPADKADKIIVHTKLLGPKQSEELNFKAPTEPGEYTFICTFPAHYLSGMHGVLVVQ